MFPLSVGKTARVTIRPHPGFDMGEGSARPIEQEVKGGTVGIILDARGRPLNLPADRARCRKAVSRWSKAMQLEN